MWLDSIVLAGNVIDTILTAVFDKCTLFTTMKQPPQTLE